jgi:protein-tyrosine kinase
MESVMEALNRARSASIVELKAKASASVAGGPAELSEGPFQAAALTAHMPSRSELKNMRVVAFDAKDPQTRVFDLLRNALLSAVDVGASRVFAVTQPSHGCGVSTLAINLAFSIARKRQWQVVVATLEAASTLDRLGLRSSSLKSCDVEGVATDGLEVDGSSVYLSDLDSLVGEDSKLSVARLTLQRDWIERVGRKSTPTILILDLPPLLMSDDAASMVSVADWALLVAAMGASTTADVESCRSMLGSTSHHIILNKARPHGL